MSPAILIVEDNSDTNDALVGLLTLRGYNVRGALDGAEALEYLEAGLKPCVIVLDLRMPTMDGQAFLRVITEDGRFNRIPVIIYSAVRESVVADMVLANMQKGRDPEILLNLIGATWPVSPL